MRTIEAVLFDLDGTLLEIDMEPFLAAYFARLAPAIGRLLGGDGDAAIRAVIAGTEAMSRPHPGRTNRDVFDEEFSRRTGVHLADDEPAALIARFYAEEFPALRDGQRPYAGAAEAVAAARALGLRVALATNPIFPEAAIVERLRWAGFSASDFDVLTSYESQHAAKPARLYFEQVAEELGVEPARCLMVGDDADLDMPASAAGMRTYYVGSGTARSDWRGSLTELVDLLPKIAAHPPANG